MGLKIQPIYRRPGPAAAAGIGTDLRRGAPWPGLTGQGQIPLDFREIQVPRGNGGPGFQLLDFLLHQFLFQVPVFVDKLTIFFEQVLFQVGSLVLFQGVGDNDYRTQFH